MKLLSLRVGRNTICLETSGPVAQLGARFHGMEEVIGSIPIRSTNHFKHLEVPPLSLVGNLGANFKTTPRTGFAGAVS